MWACPALASFPGQLALYILRGGQIARLGRSGAQSQQTAALEACHAVPFSKRALSYFVRPRIFHKYDKDFLRKEGDADGWPRIEVCSISDIKLASLAQPRPQHGSHPVSARGEVGLGTLAHFRCAQWNSFKQRLTCLRWLTS